MAFTTTYSIDNTKQYNVVANTWCRRILVQENYSSASPPTADLQQYAPGNGDSPTSVSASPQQVLVPKGTPAIFSTLGMYGPGQVVGTIETVSGSITVQQVESAQV